MRACLAAFRARARSVLRYRAAAAAAVFCQAIFGFILVMILETWYRDGSGAPISLAQAASYTWLGQAFLAFQVWGPDPELRDLIRSGEVARDLLRPTGLYGLWLARALAYKLVSVGLRFGAILVLAGLVLPAIGLGSIGLEPPTSLGGFFCFLAMLPVAALVSGTLTVGISCFQFRQVSAAGASAIAAALSSFFSGLVIPVPLLAGPLRMAAEFLPFRALGDLPFRFWTGVLPPSALPAALASQAAWILALGLGGAAFVRSRLSGLAVAGG